MLTNLTISVECADILDFPCDVLILKYAQAFYGADALVADVLAKRPEISSLLPGEHLFLPSNKTLRAKNVMFLGVVHLYHFDYREIREFSKDALKALGEFSGAEHIAMTIHGVGYGLDERESFLSQLAGLLNAARLNLAPPHLKRITIVERDKRRADILHAILRANLQEASSTERAPESARTVSGRIED